MTVKLRQALSVVITIHTLLTVLASSHYHWYQPSPL